MGLRLRGGHQDPRRAREAPALQDRARSLEPPLPRHGARPGLQVRGLTGALHPGRRRPRLHLAVGPGPWRAGRRPGGGQCSSP
ncbi:DNA-binding response regulator, OmpR family, contains REC and winged-helix (WHTH) domain (fragment) [Micrococcus sp. 116]